MYFEYNKKKSRRRKKLERQKNYRKLSEHTILVCSKRPNSQRMEKKIILARTEMEDGWIWDSGLDIIPERQLAKHTKSNGI